MRATAASPPLHTDRSQSDACHAAHSALTLLSKPQEPLRRIALRDVEMLLPYPAEQAYALRKHRVALEVVGGDRVVFAQLRGKSVRVEAVHDEFLHCLEGVVEFGVGLGLPWFGEGHFVGDELGLAMSARAQRVREEGHDESR